MGAGLGSLTLALAATGAEVRALEFDRGLMPALREAVEGIPRVTVIHADARKVDWASELHGEPWTFCANLPYNISVPLVLDVLEFAPTVTRLLVMVQREVGQRLVAGPGARGYGAVSVRVAYRAQAELVRRVPASVFWPRPDVASAVVRLERLSAPRVDADPLALWGVVDAGFAQRRKTMRNALRRMGMDAEHAADLLAACGIAPNARAEELGLAAFAALAERLPA